MVQYYEIAFESTVRQSGMIFWGFVKNFRTETHLQLFQHGPEGLLGSYFHNTMPLHLQGVSEFSTWG
jgi:hypothetical protein